MSYIGNTSTTQAFTPAIDYFSGNGSTVAFTLSRPVASVAQVQVVVNNVAQNPSTAFTVSGNTITFTGAPSSGTNNIYVQYTSPITQVIAPGQGTVAPASLSQGGPSWDTSGNVTLTGSIALNNGAADGAQLTLSSSGYSDWNWDNYSGRLRAYYGSTEYFTINASGNVGIGTSSPSTYGTGISVYRNTTDGTNSAINLVNAGTTASYAGVNITAGTVTFQQFGDAAGNAIGTAGVMLRTTSNHPMVFGTNGSERARIDTSGNMLFNSTSLGFANQRAVQIQTQSTGLVAIQHLNTETSGAAYVWFVYNGGAIGSITQNGTTAIAYNTTSDYRLKENVQPLTGALSRIAALKPCTYTWKSAPDETGEGFIAHELAEVCPQAVTGEKDALNEDGSIKAQSIDTSFLVATLTAAIQEQQAIITQLTERITALEAK